MEFFIAEQNLLNQPVKVPVPKSDQMQIMLRQARLGLALTGLELCVDVMVIVCLAVILRQNFTVGFFSDCQGESFQNLRNNNYQ